MTSMPSRTIRSPYFWAIVGGAALVLVAWLGREGYRPVITGSVAPTFSATTLDGKTVALADYQNKVVLVNIWATWCVPCRREMPSMQRLYESVRDSVGGEDFEILAVSIDVPLGRRDPSGNLGGDLRAFADELDLTFPILHDPSGAVRRIYQATAVPESHLIGKDGLIYKKMAGETQWDTPDNQALVRRLLAY